MALTSDFDLARRLFGTPEQVERQLATSAQVVRGRATADSGDGVATVVLDADAEGATAEVEVPTSNAIEDGDEVLVTIVNGSPVECVSAGSGDRMAAAVQDAHDLAASVESIAQQAIDVANATGQHFWPDTDGVHVTEVTQDEWSDSTSPNYHIGANVLLNALGQLFRDGLNNLLAIVTGTSPAIAIYDGNGNDADNILAEFASDHVRIGGDVPIGDSEEVGAASVQFFDQTSTHTSSMDASTTIDEQAASGDYGAYYDMRNETSIATSLDDDGRVVDTNSNGTASVQLKQWMSYGITDVDEQHNEVHAALVADASYSDGDTTSHAAVRATASTTNGDNLSYAELIADAIGVGTNEGSINYYPTPRVNQTFMQWWETLGFAGAGGTTFRLPYTGTWLLVTGHNSTAGANSIWILRTGGNTAFKMCGGQYITVTVSGTSVTVKSSNGTVGVYASWIG